MIWRRPPLLRQQAEGTRRQPFPTTASPFQPKVIMPRKHVPGPFIILDAQGEALRDTRGAVREFSTIARANAHLRPGDKVTPGRR
jgi:hypothetical protein